MAVPVWVIFVALLLLIEMALVLWMGWRFAGASHVSPPAKAKRGFAEIDIPDYAAGDQTLRYYISEGEMIHAIETYQLLTDSDLHEARQAVYYLAREMKAKERLSSDTGGAGVQDLLDEGRVDDAIEIYRAFMGVDRYTAQQAIDEMRQDSS